MSRSYQEGWQRIADQILGPMPRTERSTPPPPDDVDIADHPDFHDVGTLLSRRQPAPKTPEQSALPSREANIAALRALFQRVELANADPSLEFPGVVVKTGMFHHYGPDTRSLFLSHGTDGGTQSVSIHLATYFGVEGIIGIIQDNKPTSGSIQWNEATAIRRAGEILDAKGVPPLSTPQTPNAPVNY